MQVCYERHKFKFHDGQCFYNNNLQQQSVALVCVPNCPSKVFDHWEQSSTTWPVSKKSTNWYWIEAINRSYSTSWPHVSSIWRWRVAIRWLRRGYHQIRCMRVTHGVVICSVCSLGVFSLLNRYMRLLNAFSIFIYCFVEPIITIVDHRLNIFEFWYLRFKAASDTMFTYRLGTTMLPYSGTIEIVSSLINDEIDPYPTENIGKQLHLSIMKST